MAKKKTVFVCRECGYETSKWLGKCPQCGTWSSMEEVEIEPETSRPSAGTVRAKPKDISKIVSLKNVEKQKIVRIVSGIGELDRVLGGGIVPGSVILAGGEPGIGKSTLFLQMADKLSAEHKVLYASGEESQEQVALRFRRLGLRSDISFMAETELDEILAAANYLKPEILIIDSIQTVFDPELASSAGSVTQVRECTSRLVRYAKTTGSSVVIIGHVTREGNIAGPRVLEHLVDTVLYFEGETQSAFRILRAVKNRFGSTNEIGVFDMKNEGMEEVTNPSKAMLDQRLKDVAGSCTYCALEGSRSVLLEIEALVSETSFGNARRMTAGVDYNRVSLIIAVLEKKIGLKLYNQDIYVNVGGGMKVSDTAMDLAIAVSIISSFRNRVVSSDTAVFGEIGLTGEVRNINQADKRILEAKRMGIKKIILPAGNLSGKQEGIELVGVRTIYDVLEHIF